MNYPHRIMKKTAALHTLGCRLNASETGMIAQELAKRGYQIIPFGHAADLTFLNTCTVTNRADSTCRNLIRKAIKFSPQGKIVVSGCYAQMEAKKIKSMTGVDLILGNSEKHRLGEYLDQGVEEDMRIDQTSEFWSAHSTTSSRHTRGFLKIQDGCNYVCSFCIIPFARGPSRTLPIEGVIQQAKTMIQQGFKEIVLTGVNIGEYQKNQVEGLPLLLKKLSTLQGLQRIRLSSVEPNTITDELLETLSSSSKFLPHLHIPLQSGDDNILKAMRRKYDAQTYRDIIEKIKKYLPSAGIGADIIVGFPGEGEREFQHTVKLLQELPITHFHVFPYSKRQRTTAAKLPNHIPDDVKRERGQKLLALGESKLQAFASEQIGQPTKVLFEQKNKRGLWEGYTPNFVKVEAHCQTSKECQNHIYTFHPTKQQGSHLLGQFKSNPE